MGPSRSDFLSLYQRPSLNKCLVLHSLQSYQPSRAGKCNLALNQCVRSFMAFTLAYAAPPSRTEDMQTAGQNRGSAEFFNTIGPKQSFARSSSRQTSCGSSPEVRRQGVKNFRIRWSVTPEYALPAIKNFRLLIYALRCIFNFKIHSSLYAVQKTCEASFRTFPPGIRVRSPPGRPNLAPLVLPPSKGTRHDRQNRQAGHGPHRR